MIFLSLLFGNFITIDLIDDYKIKNFQDLIRGKDGVFLGCEIGFSKLSGWLNGRALDF